MAEETSPVGKSQPDKAGSKPEGKAGLMTGKYKWYVVGGLAIMAVLVFYFVHASNANASGSTTSTNSSSLDPTTLALLQQALANQANAGGGTSGLTGSQGPAGPAGPAGPPGPAGPGPGPTIVPIPSPGGGVGHVTVGPVPAQPVSFRGMTNSPATQVPHTA